MSKVFAILLIALCSFACAGTDQNDYYLDLISAWGQSDTVPLDTNAYDSLYFKAPNFSADSLTIWYEQASLASGTPSVTLTVWGTPDPIDALGTQTVPVLARQAVWESIATLGSTVTTESDMLYYQVTGNTLNSKPSRWYMLRLAAGTTGVHNVASAILRAGRVFHDGAK